MIVKCLFMFKIMLHDVALVALYVVEGLASLFSYSKLLGKGMSFILVREYRWVPLGRAFSAFTVAYFTNPIT